MRQVPGAVPVAALNKSQRNFPAFALLPAHGDLGCTEINVRKASAFPCLGTHACYTPLQNVVGRKNSLVGGDGSKLHHSVGLEAGCNPILWSWEVYLTLRNLGFLTCMFSKIILTLEAYCGNCVTNIGTRFSPMPDARNR